MNYCLDLIHFHTPVQVVLVGTIIPVSMWELHLVPFELVEHDDYPLGLVVTWLCLMVVSALDSLVVGWRDHFVVLLIIFLYFETSCKSLCGVHDPDDTPYKYLVQLNTRKICVVVQGEIHNSFYFCSSS